MSKQRLLCDRNAWGADMTMVDNKPQNTAGETRRAFLERAVREFLDLRAQGDVEAMLEWIAPDFVYNPCGAWSKAPYVPDRCDRVTFGEALRLFNVEYELLDSEIHELLVDGDRVALHRTAGSLPVPRQSGGRARGLLGYGGRRSAPPPIARRETGILPDAPWWGRVGVGARRFPIWLFGSDNRKGSGRRMR